MRKVFNASLATLMLICLFSFQKTSATENPSSWSIDLMGGTTFGHFTFGSKVTAQSSVNFRYSLNPVMSIYGNVSGGRFQGRDSMTGINGFSNDYYMGRLGTRINVLRMLAGPSGLSRFSGIYVLTGMGVIRNRVTVDDRQIQGYPGFDYSGSAFLYQLGGGITFRMGRRLDLFLQADLNHSSSELLDGYERQPGGKNMGLISGGDSFINTSAGFSIKFGSQTTRHRDWYTQEHRPEARVDNLEQSVAQIQHELEMLDRMRDQINDRLLSLTRTLNEFSYQFNTDYAEQFKIYDTRIMALLGRMDLMQSELDELAGAINVHPQVSGDMQYYVIAGVFRNELHAERMQRQLVNTGYRQASVINDRSRNYYLVAYSGHATPQEASSQLQRIRTEDNPESWIYIKEP